MCIYIYLFIYVYIYIYIYVCMYIYIYYVYVLYIHLWLQLQPTMMRHQPSFREAQMVHGISSSDAVPVREVEAPKNFSSEEFTNWIYPLR